MLGAEDFTTLLPRWYTENRDGDASTADFTELAEEVSGRCLEDFFTAWLTTPAKPALG